MKVTDYSTSDDEDNEYPVTIARARAGSFVAFLARSISAKTVLPFSARDAIMVVKGVRGLSERDETRDSIRCKIDVPRAVSPCRVRRIKFGKKSAFSRCSEEN